MIEGAYKSKPYRLIDHADELLALYKKGHTLKQIGDMYHVSHECIRQILSRKFGTTRKDGGITTLVKDRIAEQEKQRDVRCIKEYGMPYHEKEQINRENKDALKRYKQQKYNALARGKGWKLLFREWWDIWQESGLWDQRGCGIGKYCMARYCDDGDYELGNVFIQKFEQNSQDSQFDRDDDVYNYYESISAETAEVIEEQDKAKQMAEKRVILEKRMSIDELRAKLKHMNLASVARATGLTRHQVAGVANGTTRRPDYDVVKTLIEFFEGE
jgi:hypothetical protein